MKYCLRARRRYKGQNGAAGDLIWILDDDNNYLSAAVGWPERRNDHIYKLQQRQEDGRWRNLGFLDSALCRVRIRDVKLKYESQRRAIDADLTEGTISNLY